MAPHLLDRANLLFFQASRAECGSTREHAFLKGQASAAQASPARCARPKMFAKIGIVCYSLLIHRIEPLRDAGTTKNESGKCA